MRWDRLITLSIRPFSTEQCLRFGIALLCCFASVPSRGYEIVVATPSSALQQQFQQHWQAPPDVHVTWQISNIASTKAVDLLVTLGVPHEQESNLPASTQRIELYSAQPISGRFSLLRGQSASCHLASAKALLPKLDEVGVITRHAQPELDQLAKQWGITLHYADTTDPDWALPAQISALAQNNDLLLAAEDSPPFSSQQITTTLMSAYRHGRVISGLGRAYVNAGFLSACESTPADYMRTLNHWIERLRQQQPLPEAAYPQDFSVLINQQVARSLGIPVPNTTALQEQVLQLLQGAQP